MTTIADLLAFQQKYQFEGSYPEPKKVLRIPAACDHLQPKLLGLLEKGFLRFYCLSCSSLVMFQTSQTELFLPCTEKVNKVQKNEPVLKLKPKYILTQLKINV